MNPVGSFERGKRQRTRDVAWMCVSVCERVWACVSVCDRVRVWSCACVSVCYVCVHLKIWKLGRDRRSSIINKRKKCKAFSQHWFNHEISVTFKMLQCKKKKITLQMKSCKFYLGLILSTCRFPRFLEMSWCCWACVQKCVALISLLTVVTWHQWPASVP